ncbi:RNA polymerase sigma factor [Prosthecobacter vanneervenii]|uniref:RNA polymerase sigma factor (Sigma-70 family) n=1 Tax=Prosthecobacter vanneervenii TaxID=48466 RepID=A0A7W8DJS1_9BACT|nr:sigma-70 family RNA polymerase sigma factor [Prosthecobacter vanneervenii]MBB5032434.1 RNA polymerase sigma factor (sigma-70 family) [Prosthecobacter vanneervenii]
MNTATLIPRTSDDAQLVELSLQGDTRAFGSLVERHQSLICGLAYSACGNVHVSEDLAQETFITAWQQLRNLRERGNIRGWLCGIARHVINNFHRRQQRTPTAMAAEIDDATHPASAEPAPDESAIQEQESALLWRTLQTLPETYREPMVLFYRQNESVAAVAESLDISEDAVKQRLARGRAMLAEQVERRLGNTLRQSMPTAAFTCCVMAALPLATTSASAATAGMTLAKGGASGKPLVLALLNGVLSPLLAFVAAGVGYKVSMDSARSMEEQRMIKKFFRVILAAILFFCAYTVALIVYGRWLALQHPAAYVTLLTGMVAGCVLFCAGGITWALRQSRKVASAEAAIAEAASLPVGKWGVPHLEYRSRLTFLGLPLVHMRLGRKRGQPIRPVKAWFAMGDFAVGVIGAFGACTIAPISVGACSLGLISLGGLAVGAACWGGLGIGLWAIGGCALGWQAYGGCVVAWEAAQGGLAAAHHYAWGEVAVAQHVNDAVAKAAMKSSPFFQFARWAVKYAALLNLVWFLPLALLVRKARQLREQESRG